jgi:hypothetical protein
LKGKAIGDSGDHDFLTLTDIVSKIFPQKTNPLIHENPVKSTKPSLVLTRKMAFSEFLQALLALALLAANAGAATAAPASGAWTF